MHAAEFLKLALHCLLRLLDNLLKWKFVGQSETTSFSHPIPSLKVKTEKLKKRKEKGGVENFLTHMFDV